MPGCLVEGDDGVVRASPCSDGLTLLTPCREHPVNLTGENHK